MAHLELKPPFRLQKLTPGMKSVFLAGSIEMGKAEPGSMMKMASEEKMITSF